MTAPNNLNEFNHAEYPTPAARAVGLTRPDSMR